MRTKLMIIMILPLLLLECQSSIWTKLTRKDSKLFSESEKLILADTTSAVNFQYGYDPDLEMDYIYKAGIFTEKDITAKSPEMKKALLKYKTGEITSFFEKIVQLKETQVWKMNLYRKQQEWTDATYIQKYILPDTELYIDILEKNVLQVDAGYSGEIQKRKDEIKKAVEETLQEELEKKEKRYPD